MSYNVQVKYEVDSSGLKQAEGELNKIQSGLKNAGTQGQVAGNKLNSSMRGATNSTKGLNAGIGAINPALLGAAAGAAVLTTALAAASAVLTTVISELKDIQKLNDLSLFTGRAVKEFAELEGVSRVAGANFDQVASTLDRLSQRASQAAKGSKVAAEAFEQLGINVKEFANASIEKQVVLINSALANVSDTTERARLQTELLGRSARDIQKLGSTYQEYGRNVAEAGAKGLIATEAQLKAADDLDQAYNKIKSSSDGLKRSMTEAFGPEIAKQTGRLAIIMDAIAIRINEAEKGADSFANKISSFGMGGLIGVAGGWDWIGRAIDNAGARQDAFIKAQTKVRPFDPSQFNLPTVAPTVAPEPDKDALAALKRIQDQRLRDIENAKNMSLRSISDVEKATLRVMQTAQNSGTINTGLALGAIDNKFVEEYRKLSGDLAQLGFDVGLAWKDGIASAGGEIEEIIVFSQDALENIKRIAEFDPEGAEAVKRAMIESRDNAIAVNELENKRTAFLKEQVTLKERQASIDEVMVGLSEDIQLGAAAIAEMDAGRIKTGQQLAEYMSIEYQLHSTINALKRQGVTLSDEELKALRKQTEELARQGAQLAENVKRSDDQLRAVQQTAADIGNILSNSIISGLETGRFEFKNFLADLGKMLIQSGIRELIASLFSGQNGGGSGNAQGIISTLISSYFGGAQAKGGAWNNGVQYFAKGGVVDSTTPFGMSGGKTGIMGEAGAEGILPLKRMANGDMGVQTSGQGGSTYVINNNITINNPEDGADAARQTSKEIDRLMETKIRKVIREEQRSGNSMNPTVNAY